VTALPAPDRPAPRRVVRLLGVVLGAVAVAAIAGCGGGDSGDDATTIAMLDNSFAPVVTEVEPGEEVVFRNDGATVHNAVAADGSFSTEDSFGELAMQPAESTSLAVDTPGTYEFYCTFHATQDDEGTWQGMVGTLVVGDAGTAGDEAQTDDGAVTEPSGTTRNVPEDHPTIQNAVDAADPGDLVLVQPGVYREQVDVTTPSITIRGTDRHDVIVDGEFTRPNAINVVAANGVAVENLTVRNATVNGLFFNALEGYRASWITALNNGVYGIYAFDATDGLFEHSYAAGSPDAGFYIGQCDPCNGIIDNVVAEWNGLGYSGTNSSDVTIVNSTWRDNIAGIVPNTLDSELLPPVERVTIVGNLVHDNNNLDAPALPAAWGARNTGIVVAGGNDSRIERNLVVNQERSGIFITPNLSRNFWMSGGNEIRDNVVRGSGMADLTLSGVAMPGNCFSGNDVESTIAPGLQVFQGCSGPQLFMGYNLGPLSVSLGPVSEANEAADRLADAWMTAPSPTADAQPDMPDALRAPAVPAVDVMASHDLDVAAISTPTLPDDLEINRTKVPTMAGIPLVGSAFSVFFGIYAWFLPFALYATWMGLAAWDLARREDLSRAATVGWLAVVLLVPFVGPVIYYVLGRSSIPAHVRWTLVGGGLTAYLLIAGIAAFTTGVV